jgi:hypothetical protein
MTSQHELLDAMNKISKDGFGFLQENKPEMVCISLRGGWNFSSAMNDEARKLIAILREPGIHSRTTGGEALREVFTKAVEEIEYRCFTIHNDQGEVVEVTICRPDVAENYRNSLIERGLVSRSRKTLTP